MDHLYAPWRSAYAHDKSPTRDENATTDDCIFCIQYQNNDDENAFILRRLKHTIIMLNLYPYNTGHLLVLPITHVATLDALTKESRLELIEVIAASTTLLTQTLQAHGTNIGANFGKAAGAGIPAHLHVHILPRWPGDTNFLPLLANTKQISIDLHKTYHILKKEFLSLSF